MKSSINVPEKKYPYIGICDLGIVILFTAPKCGVQLAHGKAKLGGDIEIGEFSNGINEPNFVLFDGSITISN